MYDFNLSVKSRIKITVVADSLEEAKEIYSDTIKKISLEDVINEINKNEIKFKSKTMLGIIHNGKKLDRGGER